MKNITTLQEAIVHFSDYENCKSLLMEFRWPEQVTCPHCDSNRVTYLEKKRVWKCYTGHSKPTFSLKTGTIFEDSPLGLDKWLPALWMVVNCKNGISSCELARDLGVTQKTAWFMAHRLRFALTEGGFDLMSGEVEADETFIGGKARFMHERQRKTKITGTGSIGKVAVMGLLERHGQDGVGRVRAKVIRNTKKATLTKEVRVNVIQGSEVFTDALKSYDSLSSDYVHQVIDHAEKYVDGKVHTNGIENFWSLLKRGLKGTYVSVEPYHLFRYLDEQTFRYNHRKNMGDGDRFRIALAHTVGRRLTWDHLVGGIGELHPAMV